MNRRNGHWLLPCGVSLALAAGLMACSRPDNGPPTFDQTHCPFKLDPSQVLGQTVRCGYLNVDEDRTIPNGSRIQVPALVFVSPVPTAPPMMNLAGGPGQSWADLGLDSITATDSAQFKRDQIFVEQRGTGLSIPNLGCPELDATSMDNMGANMDPIGACRNRLTASGVNLAAYNTRALAADVEDLRVTLGYPVYLVNGVSYGTSWGLAILRDFPIPLKGVILDSVLPPQAPLFRGSSSGRDTALTALLQACLIDSPCNGKFPGLEAKLTQTIMALEKTPLGWSVAPSGQLTADVYVSTVDEIQTVQPGLLPFFITTVSAALTAGKTTLDPADPRIQMLLLGSMSATASLAVGQYLSIECSDNQLVTEAQVLADLATVRPVLRPYLQTAAEGDLQVCQAWTYQPYAASAFAAIASGVPSLLLSGALDARTPPAWAMDTVKTLSHGTLLEFPGLAHSVQSADSDAAQGCLTTVITQFVDSGTVADPSCVATITPQWILQ